MSPLAVPLVVLLGGFRLSLYIPTLYLWGTMASITTLVLGALAATYVFLRVVLRLTQDAREPPAILTGLPFISPVIRMGREKQKFYTRLRFVVLFV